VGGVSRGRPVARKREALLHGRYFETATGAILIAPNEVLPRKVSPSMATAPSPGFQILGAPSSMDRHNPPLSP
jgi:hypothetical protein